MPAAVQRAEPHTPLKGNNMKWMLVIFLVGAPDGGAHIKTIEMQTKELCEKAAEKVPRKHGGSRYRFVAEAFCVEVKAND